MKTTEILIAGFGGQGILFSGKFLAYKGLLEELQVSWLPSYGPEMRGGTANCNVIISEDPVGSPIVTDANILVAMTSFCPTTAPPQSSATRCCCRTIGTALSPRSV